MDDRHSYCVKQKDHTNVAMIYRLWTIDYKNFAHLKKTYNFAAILNGYISALY